MAETTASPGMRFGTNARDFGHFVDMLEFLTMDAIMAATRLGGEITGKGQCLGQVRPGYLADLLLVDGKSLEEVAILQQCNRFSAIKKKPGILEIVERGIAQARSLNRLME